MRIKRYLQASLLRTPGREPSSSSYWFRRALSDLNLSNWTRYPTSPTPGRLSASLGGWAAFGRASADIPIRVPRLVADDGDAFRGIDPETDKIAVDRQELDAGVAIDDDRLA